MALLVRPEPFSREVDRLFDAFLGQADRAGRRWVPPMDLVEAEDHFVLRADLPGLSEEDGSPNTAHSMNPVPLIVTAEVGDLGEGGILADVAPTVLKLMNLEPPPEMTGSPLF